LSAPSTSTATTRPRSRTCGPPSCARPNARPDEPRRRPRRTPAPLLARDRPHARRRAARRRRAAALGARPGTLAGRDPATQQYVKKLDKLVFGDKGGGGEEPLAKALHDAHGTAGLADACRAYRDGLGLPTDASLLSIFLDAGDPALVCAALQEIAAGRERGDLEVTSGLRTQLRLLADDANDEVAESAEDLLEQLSG
jgi:hypothetical protein